MFFILQIFLFKTMCINISFHFSLVYNKSSSNEVAFLDEDSQIYPLNGFK